MCAVNGWIMQNLEDHIASAISSGFVDDHFRVLPKLLDQVDRCTSERNVWTQKANGAWLWQFLFDLPLWFDGLRHYAGFDNGDLAASWKDYVLPVPVIGPQDESQYLLCHRLITISSESDEV